MRIKIHREVKEAYPGCADLIHHKIKVFEFKSIMAIWSFAIMDIKSMKTCARICMTLLLMLA